MFDNFSCFSFSVLDSELQIHAHASRNLMVPSLLFGERFSRLTEFLAHGCHRTDPRPLPDA